MIKKFHALSWVLAAGLVTSCTSVGSGGGGTIEVNFKSPENFTDMARSYSLQGADAGYLEELQHYIQRIGSSRLPAGYTLALTITDVDMAGQFEPERGAQFMDVRLIRSIYPPRIRLTYRLTGPDGTVRSEGERRLTNQSFEWNVSPTTRDDPLRHEKALIDDFFSQITREAR